MISIMVVSPRPTNRVYCMCDLTGHLAECTFDSSSSSVIHCPQHSVKQCTCFDCLVVTIVTLEHVGVKECLYFSSSIHKLEYCTQTRILLDFQFM